jgi:hypothetical protein
MISVLHACQSFLQGRPGRIGTSGILIALMPPWGALGIGGSLVNWCHYGAVSSIRFLAPMDSLGVKFHFPFFHDLKIYNSNLFLSFGETYYSPSRYKPYFCKKKLHEEPLVNFDFDTIII